MKNHSIQFRLCWTSFEIKLWTIEIISKHYIMWNNTGPNLIYFSTSSCLSLGQIELTKYLQFSFTLASSNSVIRRHCRTTVNNIPLGSPLASNKIFWSVQGLRRLSLLDANITPTCTPFHLILILFGTTDHKG